MLGDHLTAGRLSLDEYGERSARATHAVTRGDLKQLFADLPAPHPEFGDEPAPTPVDLTKAADTKPAKAPRPPSPYGPLGPRLMKGAAAVSGILWLILMMTGHGYFWWLLFVPGVFMQLGYSLWPDENRDKKKKHQIENRPHADYEVDPDEESAERPRLIKDDHHYDRHRRRQRRRTNRDEHF